MTKTGDLESIVKFVFSIYPFMTMKDKEEKKKLKKLQKKVKEDGFMSILEEVSEDE